MRRVVLDTETTGLDPRQGHRIIEVAAIELDGRKVSKRTFHRYINPEREIDEGAAAVHGLTLDRLQDEPKFAEVAPALLEFIDGAELIIHNAPFDMGFLNAELALAGLPPLTNSVIDTLKVAKELHPGKKNNLNALCDRYQIDNSHRTLHGALLDTELLAEVYLGMTRGQESLLGEERGEDEGIQFDASGEAIRLKRARAAGERRGVGVASCATGRDRESEQRRMRMEKAGRTSVILKWSRRVRWTLMLAVLAYLGACTYMWATQKHKIFEPRPQLQSTPERLGMKFEEVHIASGSGTEQGELYAWWMPVEAADAPTMPLSARQRQETSEPHVTSTMRHGCMPWATTLLMVDYRGYGKSTGGEPSESKVYEDAESAWMYLVKQKSIEPKRIFIYGHSMGGAVAIDLASHHANAGGAHRRKQIHFDGGHGQAQILLHAGRPAGEPAFRLDRARSAGSRFPCC